MHVLAPLRWPSRSSSYGPGPRSRASGTTRPRAELLQATASSRKPTRRSTRSRPSAAAARQEVADRTRALYESGGDPAVLASMLGGDNPLDAIDRYNLAAAVITYEVRNANNAAQLPSRRPKTSTSTTQRSPRGSRSCRSRPPRRPSQIDAALSRRSEQELANANGDGAATHAGHRGAQLAQGADELRRAPSRAAGGSVGSRDRTGRRTRPSPPRSPGRAPAGSATLSCGVAPARTPSTAAGLTQWSYAHAGITLPRVAADQYNAGPHPSLADLEPGDLLFWATDIVESCDHPPRHDVHRRWADDRRAAHRHRRPDPAGLHARFHRRDAALGRITTASLSPEQRALRRIKSVVAGLG